MSKRRAKEEAKTNSKLLGGSWHVVKLEGDYYAVHEHYFKTHTQVRSVFSTNDPYRIRVVWYRLPIYWINVALKTILKPWLIE